MDRDPDKESDEIMEDFADDLLGKDEDFPHRRVSTDTKAHGKTIILWAVGILIFVAIMSFLFGGGSEVSKEELDAVKTRLDLLEKRAANLEGVEGRIAHLEKGDKKLQQSITKRDKSIRFLKSRINKLNQRIDRLQKSVASTSVRTKPPDIKQEKQTSPVKGHYHEVRVGESLYRIAHQYGMSVDELCRINNITTDHAIQPGQKLKVAPPGRQ